MKIYIEHDLELDLLYLGFQQQPIEAGSVARTVPITENILVDLDSKDRLAGVELIGASKVLEGDPGEIEIDALIGVKEAAELLGVTKSNFIRDYANKAAFPKPVAELASGRIWVKSKVEAYKRNRKSRKAEGA